MERDAVVGAIMAGNEAALQWYATTHQVPIAAPAVNTGVSLGPTGFSATLGSGGAAVLLVVGVVLAFVVLSK